MQEAENDTSLSAEQQEELEKQLHKATREDRIQCAVALAIARSLGIPPGEVGKTANKLNIRISKCQLGCF